MICVMLHRECPHVYALPQWSGFPGWSGRNGPHLLAPSSRRNGHEKMNKIWRQFASDWNLEEHAKRFVGGAHTCRIWILIHFWEIYARISGLYPVIWGTQMGGNCNFHSVPAWVGVVGTLCRKNVARKYLRTAYFQWERICIEMCRMRVLLILGK